MARGKSRAEKRLNETDRCYWEDDDLVALVASEEDNGDRVMVYRVINESGKFEIRVDVETEISGTFVREKNCLRFGFDTREEAVGKILESLKSTKGDLVIVRGERA